MTHQEVKALAGHRAIPPWIMKLVSDAIAIEVAREREASAKELDEISKEAKNVAPNGYVWKTIKECAAAIRARGNTTSRGEA